MPLLRVSMYLSLFVFLILYEFAGVRMLRALRFELSGSFVYQGLVFLAMAALLFGMVWFSIPLPFFYVLVYALCCCAILPHSGNQRRNWYLINIRFLLFVTLHLIVLGTMALDPNTNVKEILTHMDQRGLSLLIVLGVNTLVDLLIASRLRKNPIGNDYDSEEFSMLFKFNWFCIVFVLIDSVPGLFELPSNLVSMFLIGSNVLMVGMNVLFVFHVYTILKNAHLKDEYLTLALARREQHLRTEYLQKAAYIDSLTGAYTRRYALGHMQTLLDEGEPFALVYIDLDYLKRVNDDKGHLAGDRYLEDFSRRMRERLRNTDVFARIGGDEFLILMPGCELQAARNRMLCTRVEMEERGTGLPFSFGIIEVPAFTKKSLSDLLNEADQRMYEDKHQRR